MAQGKGLRNGTMCAGGGHQVCRGKAPGVQDEDIFRILHVLSTGQSTELHTGLTGNYFFPGADNRVTEFAEMSIEL